MKKRISLLTAAALSLTMLTSLPANAEDDTAADLPALASSLGADSGHFSKTSSSYISGEDDILNKSPYFWFGYDYALSAIQALVRNGTVKPSDIMPGAEKLTDIAPSESVNSIIGEYSASASERATELFYGYEYCQTSQADMVKKLISAAEDSMKNNRYFLVILKNENNRFDSSSSSAFTATGIGIADGSWTFDGVTYDKCILTLAPSSSKAPDNTGEIQKMTDDNAGFQERYCIYADPATGKFTVPARHGCNNDGFDIYAVCTSDDILSYKGGSFPADISDVQNVTIHNGSHLEYTINDKHSGKWGEPSGTVCKNYLYSHDHELTYFGKGSSYRIETTAGQGAFRGNHSRFSMSLTSESCFKYADLGGAFIADMSDTGLKLAKKPESFTTGKEWLDSDNEYYYYSIDREEPLYGFRRYSIAGLSTGNIEFEVREDGVYIADSSLLKVGFSAGNVHQTDIATDEDLGAGVSIYSNDPVMLRFDEKDGRWYIYRDSDGSGKFTGKVQTGDVNCDGRIDAKDASLILKAYADSSNGRAVASYIDRNYADFSGDGKLKAADASAVLRHYADTAAGTD